MKVSHSNITSIQTDHVVSLYETMKEHGDRSNSNKMIDLYDKLVSDEFIISFTGHFSAGKSSIINYLVGMDVLPNSPIPTSANIVKLTSGEGVARVYFNEADTVEYKEPYDIDMIKEYCMTKDTISRLEINTKENILPAQTAILDTPGIDAADDADRIMTESSLHLVDVLYYVMDYNHVQSEVNLYFLKEIQAQGIPIYIIINQIDKHNEAEIAFTAFDKSVKQTFDQWKISPENIYYTSALKLDAPYNQIDQFKQDIFQLLDAGRKSNQRIHRATELIVKAYEESLKESAEDKLMDFVQNNIPAFDLSKYTALQTNLAEISSKESKLQEAFYEEVDFTLKNAYLMPAKLRDAAGEFLETQQKEFKVGFFQSKKKTEEVKRQKLQAFLDPLQDTIESTIQWKLREKFVELLNEYEITDESLHQKAQHFQIRFGKAHLIDLIKQGAMINGNYILNYTNDVSADIKTSYRKAAASLWKDTAHFLNESVQAQARIIEKELHSFDKIDRYVSMEEKLEKKLLVQLDELNQVLQNPKATNQTIREIEEMLRQRKTVVEEALPVERTIKEIVVNDKEPHEASFTPGQHPGTAFESDNIFQKIDEVTTVLNDMPVFETLLNELTDKQSKLKNRALTIALFGAFSAGKSSFSNALFGEHVLPVSPNPTTAVISRISPVTDRHRHATVIIRCKDDKTMTKDLAMITKELNPDAEQFHDMIDWIKRGHIQYNQSLSNMYQSYLLAVLKGYEEHKDILGKTIEISLDEFEAFVTDESKACYIETVDLYYDCALTKKGITIVDTPGADSVNARHTNVAFDYIKEADAILYVTYYNHAITRADRDFLMQLGRVKEAFELDKMYFIVNASDLAQTEQDLQMVLDYVETQLLQFGIRNPRIYPVSSKQSLSEKVNKQDLNDEMKRFERDFYTFIEKDLAALAIESIVWDFERAKGILKNFIDTANMDNTEQHKHITHLESKQARIAELIANINTDIASNRLEERITRQLHFVLERVYIRFHEMFTQFFNPTTITGSGRKAHTELELNSNRFLDYIGYELLQEVRAVSLRIEGYMKELMKETYETLQINVKDVDPTLIIPGLHELEIETPVYQEAFTQLDAAIFDVGMKIFKNKKAFFENNDRNKMKDAFYQTLQPYAKAYLAENKVIMTDVYRGKWNEETKRMKHYILTEMTLIVQGNIKMITDSIDVNDLENKHRKLTSILNKE